jgi:hypothetical protein
MRRKSGIILPSGVEVADRPEPVKTSEHRSGCTKRRQRGNRNVQTHCVCGFKLKTRRGETRCPVHGTSWAAQNWELAGVTVTDIPDAPQRSN